MTLSTFPTFLTFLTQALCFPVPASDSWQGLEIPSYPRRERLGPQTVGPEGDALTGSWRARAGRRWRSDSQAVAPRSAGSRVAMGKYLDLLDRAGLYDINDQNDQRGGFGRLCRTFATLETRCPELVPVDRWQAAVDRGRRFLARWGEQADALGWTARDLVGLPAPPATPHPSYNRPSRYDETGLIWLLQGRPVVALTEATAAIQSSTGAITTYRSYNKPAFGPVGDSLDDFK